MSKITQIVFAMSCLWECEKTTRKGRSVKKLVGLRWITQSVGFCLLVFWHLEFLGTG